MALAKYGTRQVVVSTAILLPLTVVTGIFLPWLCPVFAILLCWVFYFFRDPNRVVPDGDGVVVAPADGKIVEISECEEGEFVQGPALKLGIFLSVFDVHINRVPCAGEVKYVEYREGKFHNAMLSKSSEFNERNSVGFEHTASDRSVRVLVKQIAGAIARRIVCECKPGDALARGEKFGMIKFGSRTELYIPKDVEFELTAEMGQKVAAGETILGRFR